MRLAVVLVQTQAVGEDRPRLRHRVFLAEPEVDVRMAVQRVGRFGVFFGRLLVQALGVQVVVADGRAVAGRRLLDLRELHEDVP